ncbi:AraC family transcriptional regulator [Kribbella flavida]|uniref:AraC family transcriptional regulator n=1 Tax=Kribbella flavida TaxID=182640 RepID=UPI000674C87B|nr:AraC family transcriptional regulator [Kribbella flavida]
MSELTISVRRLRLRPSHRFPRHAHQSWSFGLVSTGKVRLWSSGSWHTAAFGLATVLPPGQVHEGVIDEAGLAYDAVTVRPEYVADVLATGSTPSVRGLLHLPGPIRQLARADRSVGAEERRELVLAAVSRLFEHPPGAETDGRAGGRLAVAVRHRLDQRFREPVDVRTLAAELGVAPATVIRAFQQYAGLSPYAYVISQRVDLARRLLDGGERPADAALRAGFFDQAHLNRHFVRLVGVPPGVYRRS